jgi:hypothetical protein
MEMIFYKAEKTSTRNLGFSWASLRGLGLVFGLED